MVTNDIDRLLARHFAGELNPQDEIRLDKWLNESEENEKYFFQLTSLYQSVSVTDFPDFDTQSAFNKFSNHICKEDEGKKKSDRKVARTLLWAVATVAAVAALFIVFRNDSSYTTITNQASYTLANNTKVTLSEGEIRIDKDVANDTIYLQGMAQFAMKSETEGSKIVKAGNVYIKDIGTQFAVDAKNPDSVHVSVSEGEVLFYADSDEGINLRVNESGYYLAKTNMFYKIVPKGNFNFSGTSLDEVANRLTEFYGQPVRIEDESMGKLLLNANFEHEDLATVLDILSVALNLKVSYRNGEYLIEKQS